jgi:hypothetical protein
MTGQLIITYPRMIVRDTKKHPSRRGTEVAREIQYPICVSPNDTVERAVQGEARKTAHDWTRAKGWKIKIANSRSLTLSTFLRPPCAGSGRRKIEM